MKKRLKIIYGIGLTIMFILISVKIFNIYTKRNNEISNNIESETKPDTDKKETESTILGADIKPLLENYSELFEWCDGKKPIVDTYDAEKQKKREYLAYGVSVDEYKYRKKIYENEIAADKASSLDSAYYGNGKYSKDKMFVLGEEIDRKYMSCKTNIASIAFNNKIIFNIEDKYFLEATRNQILDNVKRDYETVNGEQVSNSATVENMQVYDLTTGKLCANQKIYYVMLNITINSNSNWVQDTLIAPKLVYLQKKDDMLETYANPPVYIEINGKKLTKSEYGIYNFAASNYDKIIYYDYDDEACRDSVPQCHSPIRKGESVSAIVYYLVPEAYLEDAYFMYSDIEEFEEIQNTYNFSEVSIVSLYREYDINK